MNALLWLNGKRHALIAWWAAWPTQRWRRPSLEEQRQRRAQAKRRTP